MSHRLFTFLGALMMLPTACLADIASFSTFSDEQLKELASELNVLCRGHMEKASESMRKFVCTIRDESWDAVERRGYCYRTLGKEMFPKCDAITTPEPYISPALGSATAEEVIQKTREAAEYLIIEGEKGLATFNSRNAQSFWKADGYVFVIDCEHGKLLAHPTIGIPGTPLEEMKDSRGLPLAKPYCENGLRPNGGWFESFLPKPTRTKVVRKLLYIRPVPGTTYQVASGIYDETVTIEALNKLIVSK